MSWQVYKLRIIRVPVSHEDIRVCCRLQRSLYYCRVTEVPESERQNVSRYCRETEKIPARNRLKLVCYNGPTHSHVLIICQELHHVSEGQQLLI